MDSFYERAYHDWLAKNISEERSPRRRELLKKGLGHGIETFLRTIWFPAVGNFDHLYPEWEIRDFNNGYRYLDLAYMPAGAKGCIEIQDYRSHARDVDAKRFKDLNMKQSLIALDDWLFLPIAYLSIKEDPEVCKQLTLSFIGKFISTSIPESLDWAEAETLRFARRLLRPFAADELSQHLQLSARHTRRILQQLTTKHLLVVVGGKQRYRTYWLARR